MGKTIAEKILARAAGKDSVTPGEYVYARPDIVVLIELMWPAIKKSFVEAGATKVWDPNKVVFIIDHCVPTGNSPPTALINESIRRFVKEHGIKQFYDIGRHGISHQLAGDKGLAPPGSFYCCDDGNGTTLGAFGSLAVPLSTEVYAVLALGEHWFKVPESMLFTIKGSLPKGVMARDVIQKILADLGPEGASYKVMEFNGPAVDEMSIDGRMTLCSLVQHVGAKTGIVNPDEKTVEYVRSRSDLPFNAVRSDPDSEYSDRFEYDISSLEPQVALPPDPLNVRPINEVEGIEVNSAYIGSCASGRMEDIRIAAQILKAKSVHPDVRLLIVPSSQDMYTQAAEEGLLQVFSRAGATVLGPGCGPCFGYLEPLVDGDKRIASSVVNYPGRMGSSKASIYLANPAVVAASAISGKISDPRKLV